MTMMQSRPSGETRAQRLAREAWEAHQASDQRKRMSALEKYCPQTPTERQAEFLALDVPEALYGGAAFGAKSSALLMAALQYVDEPGYAALLLRRTYADLAKPGALMDRAYGWLRPTDARWVGSERRWLFPSGASLSFGYVERFADVYQYQSAEYQFIGFDELTQHEERCYTYLFSRLRRRRGVRIPLRMRAASNPGGVGHEWVKARFVGEGAVATFVPSRLEDNPHVDIAAYRRSLAELDDVTRAQLEWGDWDVVPAGDVFSRAWFDGQFVDVVDVPMDAQRIRYWDKAGTRGAGAYTVGVRMARSRDGRYFFEDVVRGQWEAAEREPQIRATAEADGRSVTVWQEQEPGSGGKESAQTTARNLVGFHVEWEPVTGDKATRARPFATQCKAHNVYIVRGPWNTTYLNELVAAPNGPYMDQVDASSGAFNKLALAPRPGTWTNQAIGRAGRHWTRGL
jgi:predicted phage terminase large subunit-like protein